MLPINSLKDKRATEIQIDEDKDYSKLDSEIFQLMRELESSRKDEDRQEFDVIVKQRVIGNSMEPLNPALTPDCYLNLS